MVPMASRLRAKCAATAFATPTPPTSSVVNATRVRNWVKRSTLRSSCGDALSRRADLPTGVGKGRLRLFVDRRHGAVARVRGEAQPVLPAHQAAGLDEAGGAQRRLADEHARPEADAGREPSGSLISAARRSIVALPMVIRSPVFRLSRASSAGSTAAPNAPSFSASSAGSGVSGSLTTLPNSG